MTGVIRLMQTLGGVLPPRVAAGIALALLVLAFPGWLRSVQARQIRSQVRRVSIASSEERPVREAEVMSMASDGNRLVVLAEAALQFNQRALAERALEALQKLGSHPIDEVRLRRALAPPRAAPDYAIEAVVAIRRLQAEGLTDLAKERLAEARARFPNDPDLAAMEDEGGPGGVA